MKELTIFTPTYNRQDDLGQLYESLKSQASQDFLWMIVDDGSIDDTGLSVQKWIQEGIIDIQYFYQENQGKHMAMARAVVECQTPWFICVDSDDIMPLGAVRGVYMDINCTLPAGCIGYIYPRYMPEQREQMRFSNGLPPIHIMDAKNLCRVRETAILFQTKYLKKLEFFQFAGENFLSEEVLYIQLSQYGKFVPKNRMVYQSEYRSNGLTHNIFQVWMKNPQGTVLLLNERYKFCGEYRFWIRVRERVKCILNLNAFYMACGIPIFEVTPNKWYSTVLYMPSIAWRRMRFS